MVIINDQALLAVQLLTPLYVLYTFFYILLILKYNLCVQSDTFFFLQFLRQTLHNSDSAVFVIYLCRLIFCWFVSQVTETSSSVSMEPVGFKRAVNRIQDEGIKINVVTTDRSPSIRKIMRVDYPDIHHEFDIWHVVKGM